MYEDDTVDSKVNIYHDEISNTDFDTYQYNTTSTKKRLDFAQSARIL